MPAPATLTVFDSVYDDKGAAIANTTVTCVLDSTVETFASGLIAATQQTTTTDTNGRFQFTVIANDLLSPANSTYTISIPAISRSYQIAPQSGNGSSQQTTAANVIVNTPNAIAPWTNLTGNLTVAGTLGVTGLTSDNGGLVVAGGAGATLNASGDLAVRSVTVSSGSGPYVTGSFGKAGTVMNVIYAGITGDGVADDSIPINAAITAAPATGATIIIPGTTTNVARCASAILVNKANITIEFAGGVTVKAANSLNADLIQITASNVFILNGIIDGNKLNNASGNGVTIDSPNANTLVSGVHLLNCIIQHTAGFGVGIKVSGTGTAQVTGVGILDGCNITDTNTGIFINGRTASGVDLTTVRDCIINTTIQHGIVSTGANRTIVDGCSFLNIGLTKVTGFAHGIAVDGNGGTNPNSRHRISNNWVINPCDAGIEIADAITGCSIVGNHIFGAGQGPNVANTYGIFFGGALSLSLQAEIAANECISCVGDGFRVLGPDGAHLTDKVSLVGNVASANGANALTLTNVGTDVHAFGNTGFPQDINSTANSIYKVTGDIVTQPSGAMRPFSDGLHDLGGSGLRYKRLWLSQSAQVGLAALAYSASITPDASLGNWQSVTVTNATAFTVNAPTNPPSATSSQSLAIEVFNSSGGAMGVITWNGVFKFAGFTWANPANTAHRFVRFEWNNGSWVATSMSSADY